MISSESLKENKSIKAIIICGPTGSGKSDLGMRVAEKYGGSIIGADSRQIYRRLNIGTAKPSKEARARIPHYMVDIAEITEDFTAKRYAEMALRAIETISDSERIPIVVGGTGLYIEALTTGLFEGPERDENVRRDLEETAGRIGSASLHKQLMRVDPAAANAISPNDTVRIIRALEIYRLTGRIPSKLKKERRYVTPDARFFWIALDLDRKLLYERIDRRIDTMIEEGLIGEIEELMADGLSEPLKKKKIIGYYEFVDALERRGSTGEATDLVKQHSRNYAKRQMTWFRNRTSPNWLDPDRLGFHDKVFGLIDDYLKRA